MPTSHAELMISAEKRWPDQTVALFIGVAVVIVSSLLSLSLCHMYVPIGIKKPTNCDANTPTNTEEKRQSYVCVSFEFRGRGFSCAKYQCLGTSSNSVPCCDPFVYLVLRVTRSASAHLCGCSCGSGYCRHTNALLPLFSPLPSWINTNARSYWYSYLHCIIRSQTCIIQE